MNTKYNPQRDLLQGISQCWQMEIAPWDDYYVRMAQTDFLSGKSKRLATKTFFFRSAPFGGSYAIFGGLTHFLYVLQNLTFDINDPDPARAERAKATVACLRDTGYREDFINALIALKKLKLRIRSSLEGSIIVPNQPVLVMNGDLISIRIAEGILLTCVNFPTLSMTKWNRLVCAAGSGGVLEFGRRRSQDALRTSLYSYLAGCKFTSNSEIRRGFDIPVAGTMGHEFVQSRGDEFSAFDEWLTFNPERPVLLVDTVDTLRSGLPNAMKAFKKHAASIETAGGKMGIRLDSGDLAYLTIEARRVLDEAGLSDVSIVETNDLDEYLIEQIREQIFTHAPSANLDANSVISRIIWAAGTRPSTCYDQPTLGGVAKLTGIEDDDGRMRPVIKLANDNPIKTSIPDDNLATFVWRDDELLCCLVHQTLVDRAMDVEIGIHPNDRTKTIDLRGATRFDHRQFPVYDSLLGNGKINYDTSIDTIIERVRSEVRSLHWTNKRLVNPHSIKLSLSPRLFDLRQKMIETRSLISPVD